MPVYLPPISRRRFLTRSATAIASLAVAPSCLSQQSQKDGRSIALLSDIHIAADPATLTHNINPTDHLKMVIKEVLAWPQLPTTVFINGDLACKDGELADYSAVMGLIHPLREADMPIHVNMGNHDDREHLWSVMKDEKSIPTQLPGRQVSIVRTPEANWFMLDSLIKTLTTPGNLGDEQRAWLVSALDANPDKPAIVLIHHQPGTHIPAKRGAGLEDTKELMAILRPRKQVKAYIFGHTHRWEVKQDESGIHMINLPATSYVFDSTVSTGWVHLQLRTDSATFEMRSLDRNHKDHGKTANLSWRSV